jgi:hypothetical protein
MGSDCLVWRWSRRPGFVWDRAGVAGVEDGCIRSGLADESVDAVAVDGGVRPGSVWVGVRGARVLAGASVVVSA